VLALSPYLTFESWNEYYFNVDSSGNVILTPHSKDIRSLKGIVRSRLKKRPVSAKEMNEANAEGFSFLTMTSLDKMLGPIPRRRRRNR
jgi:hypothetical protein